MKPKTDVYERITNRVIEQLEAGVVPWHKPWNGQTSAPRNLISDKAYRGINLFLLACSDYASPYWLTFKQAQQIGGSVRKGETSTPIIFWQWLERENAETGKTEKIPLLRHYNVFNAEQCDLPDEKRPALPVETTHEFSPIAICETVVAGMPQRPELRHEGTQPSYQPATDRVRMPRPELFEGAEEYYGTLFHELTHSTGHPQRLNREGINQVAAFGSATYSKEELVAEMGAAFLCGHCGIDVATLDNSTAYIASWLRVLKSDKRLVIHAAAAAQKAADFILGISHQHEETEV